MKRFRPRLLKIQAGRQNESKPRTVVLDLEEHVTFGGSKPRPDTLSRFTNVEMNRQEVRELAYHLLRMADEMTHTTEEDEDSMAAVYISINNKRAKGLQ